MSKSLKRNSDSLCTDHDSRLAKKIKPNNVTFEDHQSFLKNPVFTSIQQSINMFMSEKTDDSRTKLLNHDTNNLCMYLLFHKKQSSFEKHYMHFIENVFENELDLFEDEHGNAKEFEKEQKRQIIEFLGDTFDATQMFTEEQFSLDKITPLIDTIPIFDILKDDVICEKIRECFLDLIEMDESKRNDFCSGSLFLVYIIYFDNFINVFRHLKDNHAKQKINDFHVIWCEKFVRRSVNIFEFGFDFKMAVKLAKECIFDKDFSIKNRKKILRKLHIAKLEKQFGNKIKMTSEQFDEKCEKTYRERLGFKDYMEMPENILIQLHDRMKGVSKDPFVDFLIKKINLDQLHNILDFILGNAKWFNV